MLDSLSKLFAEGGFLPHGYCIAWDKPLLWTLVASNLLTALAYYAIPLAIWVFLRRQRHIQFNWMFVMFALFILACGTTHVLDVVNFWIPVYRLDALVLVVTAAVSVATAVMLWPLIPEAVAFLKDRQNALEKLQETNFRLRESFEELDDSNRKLRSSERELRLTLESAPIGMAIVALDGRYRVVNDALCRMLGYQEDELLRLRFQDITHPDDLATSNAEVNDLIAGNRSSYRIEKRYRTKSGRYIDIQLDVCLLRDEAGSPVHFISQIQDISERKQLDEQLRDNNVKLESSLSQIIRWNREITALGELSKTLQYCDSLEELGTAFGSLAESLFDHSTGVLYVIDDNGDALVSLAQWGEPPAPREVDLDGWSCWAMRTGQPRWSDQSDGLCCEHLGSHNSQPLTLCLPLRVKDGEVGLLCLFPDFSEISDDEEARDELLRLATMAVDRVDIGIANIQLRETLRRQSISDPLTGLFNRRYFDDMLPREINRARRNQHSLTLMMIDADHFKRINDSCGHDFGDSVLRTIGRTLVESVRSCDIVCRFGGEEFAILLPDMDTADASRKAEQLRAAIVRASRLLANSANAAVTVSIGIATYPGNAENGDQLFRNADAALYVAKERGRDQVAISNAA